MSFIYMFIFLFALLLVRAYMQSSSDSLVVTTDEELYDEGLKLVRFMLVKNDYMLSQTWRDKRHQVLLKNDFKCELCYSDRHLQVHHTSGYMLIPNEPISSLACLCRSCHEKQHDYYGYPNTHAGYRYWNAPLIQND